MYIYTYSGDRVCGLPLGTHSVRILSTDITGSSTEVSTGRTLLTVVPVGETFTGRCRPTGIALHIISFHFIPLYNIPPFVTCSLCRHHEEQYQQQQQQQQQ